jgi:hypothetical protein
MTQKIWVLVLAIGLVLIILHEGQAFATDVGEHKKIVMVPNSVVLELLQPALLGSGIKVVHSLSCINALAIELSPNGTIEQASATLDNLLKSVLGLLASKVVVSNDLVGSVLRIARAPLEDVPLQETYGWGLEHIHVDEAHETSDATGSEVKIAVVDTGVDCGHPDLRLFIEGFNALPDGGVALHVTILLANSNQWYFKRLVKIPCHKTPYRCPHCLNLSSQSNRFCAGPSIKALKDKDLEFANGIRHRGGASW